MTAKRHVPDCACSCDCTIPPVSCNLYGSVSGSDINLSWTYSGTKINRVSIYRADTSSDLSDYSLVRPVLIYESSDTNVRTLTVPNGLCGIYLLAVCNPCGCCYSKWVDGRSGHCECYSCTYLSGSNTLTRRYTGLPNIQCGCRRGKVYSMSATLSGVSGLYTSDVDRTVHNPNGATIAVTTEQCYCDCTGAPGFQGVPLPDGKVFREYTWEEVSGADCLNGTYIFNVEEANYDLVYGAGCGYVVNPSYYHLGTITTRRRGAAFPAVSWEPCTDIAKTSAYCNNRYITPIATSTYEVFLIGAAELLNGTSQLDGNGNPVTIDYLGGGAMGPAISSGVLMFPRLLVIRTGTNDSSIATSEPSPVFLFETCDTNITKMANMPYMDSGYEAVAGALPSWVYPNPADNCGWVKESKTLTYDTTRYANSEYCAILTQYTLPPSGPVKYTNCDRFGNCTETLHSLGRLMMYAHGETVFTTEFN